VSSQTHTLDTFVPRKKPQCPLNMRHLRLHNV